MNDDRQVTVTPVEPCECCDCSSEPESITVTISDGPFMCDHPDCWSATVPLMLPPEQWPR